MLRSSLLILSAWLLFAGPPIAFAQQPESPPSWAWRPRVRVTFTGTSHGRMVGTYLRTAADTIWLDAGMTRPSPIPLERVATFEVSRGRHSNAGRGALIGSAVGLGLGLIASIESASEDDSFVETSTGEYVLATFMLAAMGGGLGAAVGAMTHSEEWEVVPVARLTVTRGPSPDVRVGLSIRL